MLLKKVIFTFLVVVSLGIPPCQAAQNTHSIHSQLQEIPQDDKERLSLFFEALVRLDTFGYTIFGSKPVSCISYTPNLRGNFIFPVGEIFSKGEKLWNSYWPSFGVKKFVFKFEHRGNECDIFLINKIKFREVVNEHIDEFRKILGENITADGLFLQIIDNKNCLWQTLKEDHCLVGILLGYGYKNAQLFKRRAEIVDLIASFPPPLDIPEQIDILSNHDNRLINSQETIHLQPENIEELLLEYNHMKNTLTGTHADSCDLLNLFPEVGFLADPDSTETKMLLEQYSNTKTDIMNAFITDNFLEAVLCKMAED